MFRSKALAKLQSPEKLDKPQKMLRRKSRLALYTLIALIVLAAGWGLSGQVPVEGMGRGILITPESVKSIQAESSGQIVNWIHAEGDFVEKGTVVGTIDQPGLQQQLEQAIAKMGEVQESTRVRRQLRDRYTFLRRRSIETQRKNLQSQIAYVEKYIERTRELSEAMHELNGKVLVTQKQNLENGLQHATAIEQALGQRLQSYRKLKEENLISDDQLRSVRQDNEEANLRVRELELQIKQLDLRRFELNESYLNTQNLIATRENSLTKLNLQLRELENTIAKLEKEGSEFTFQQNNKLRELERYIERTERQLDIAREVRTEFSGRILELAAAEGSFVNQGQVLVQIDTRAPDDRLVALAYFSAKEGKRLQKGMMVRVSPSTVDQKEHGSIIGHVETISDYPVTVDSAANLIGNRSLARQLTADGNGIKVVVAMQENTGNPSGFEWTSRKGPDIQLTAGTAVNVWATVEQRHPISYVLPMIKEWGGL